MTIFLALILGQLATSPPPSVSTTSSTGSSGQSARSNHTHRGVSEIDISGTDTPSTGSAGPLFFKAAGACTITRAPNATYGNPEFTFDCPAGAGAAHNLLSATHSDSVGGGTEATGDLPYRNGSAKWTNLHVGLSTQVLKGGTTPTWGSVAFSEISGTATVAQGGSGQTAWADDTVLVGDGANPQPKTLPSCTGAGLYLTYNPASNAFGCSPPSNALTVAAALAAGSLTAAPGAFPLPPCNALRRTHCK